MLSWFLCLTKIHSWFGIYYEMNREKPEWIRLFRKDVCRHCAAKRVKYLGDVFYGQLVAWGDVDL